MEEVKAVNWKSKLYRKEYNRQYRLRMKEMAASKAIAIDDTVKKPSTNGQKPLSPWKLRQMERQEKEEAKKAHPLGLESCPFCGASYFRKLGGKTEPVKMDHCDPCAKRFYYYNGAKA